VRQWARPGVGRHAGEDRDPAFADAHMEKLDSGLRRNDGKKNTPRFGDQRFSRRRSLRCSGLFAS
jgi:hypothetical protein